MALIESIQAQIVTGYVKNSLKVNGEYSNAGTDGSVFLGIGGREFRLDTTSDDYELASDRTYILGLDANVNYPSINDPRYPQLYTEFLDRTPVYIRFQPETFDDDWQLRSVRIAVNPGPQEVVFEKDFSVGMWGFPLFLWLGMHSGTYAYLLRSN